MPPWNTTETAYCHTVNGYSGGWTSDSAFCVSGAASFWQTCLFIGLAFWGFFTVLQLFTAFDLQHMHGQALGRTVSHLVRQIILLLLACASFFLMMLVHQLVFLICNALVGGQLEPWRVDDLWTGAGSTNVLSALQTHLDAPYANNPLLNLCNIFSGGNCGFGQPQIGGSTFFQIAQGIGFLAELLLHATGAIRFVIMLVLLGTAPLAIIAAGFSHFRERVFRLWLTKWLELEGLAILTALGIAAFQGVLCGGTNDCSQMSTVEQKYFGTNSAQFVFLLLGFAVIICGLQVGYIWNFIGSFIELGTNMYRADYNRDVGTIKAIANLAGMVIPMVGDIANSVMSAIPQANGYGGDTMAPAQTQGSGGGGGLDSLGSPEDGGANLDAAASSPGGVTITPVPPGAIASRYKLLAAPQSAQGPGNAASTAGNTAAGDAATGSITASGADAAAAALI